MILSLGNYSVMISLLAVALPLVIILLLALKLAIHSWQVKRKVKEVSFAGLIGRAESDVNNSGMIFVRGELWHAYSQQPIAKGETVRIIGCRNLRLEVEQAQ
jgi:membrane-bound ClpP family serine protease